MQTDNEYFIWVDLETTGLTPETDQILEIAVIVTTPDLTQVGPAYTQIIKPYPDIDKDALHPKVVEMHEANGLWADMLTNGTPIGLVETELLAYLAEHAPGKRYLAGNNIPFDQAFLRTHMPLIVDACHYRMIDVSTVKELVKHWAPHIAATLPEKTYGHRALDDIKESIAEAQHYKNEIFQ